LILGARESEVIGLSSAVVFPSNNVVDLKLEHSEFSGILAVLAASLSPVPDEFLEVAFHHE
jgi:hypothetical protein